MRNYLLFTILLFLFPTGISAQSGFNIIPLGVKGGIDESNLSAYLVAPKGSENYVSLDAGTLYAGLTKAIENGIFTGDAATILRNRIKGYLISHAHSDHVSGLIINSPDDSGKNIYAMPYVVDVLKDKYFNWRSWANFADEGDKPALKKYHYTVLKAGEETPLENTDMRVMPYVLSHSNPYQSTAFLISHSGDYLLYLGDTGADKLEKSDKLTLLWQQIAPLIKSKKLKAIFIETSFPDEQPDKLLFGHLTPTLLMEEMDVLASYCGAAKLKGFPLVITHRKPSGVNELTITHQLKAKNKLGLQLIYPQQGRLLEF